ncbi:SusD/RagB family nutrient-binding outer membrane lipoprotein [Chryseolinea sp. H1M3-3]|uniref:SusD/RagB family nutrient-binding outer membrane lipoprotein n=1 Tax=Chryseolinea sp. H1M3-3 TaxID=3034144 RepID=UPI0023EB4B91|nr:SusD/RagB family nutrient-binding outer membrane lipoprotein [Chryseolinea sp. H1M3-3]
MKSKLYKILAVFACIGLLSCEKDFLDINDDPNNPLDVSLELLLPSTQLDMAGALGTSGGGLSRVTSIYMHHWVERRPTLNDYALSGSDFGVTAPWLVLYTRTLADIEIIIQKANEVEAFPYLGIAQIMKAYAYSLMVDTWGDVPFSEAHKAGNLTPAYDRGEDIYPQLFTLLNEGIANMEKESDFQVGNEDLIYGGDTDLWIKFANSVKLKMYNQIREVQDVSAEVSALLAEGNLISDGSEDFQLYYGVGTGPDNRNPGYVQEWNAGNANYNISPYFYETMANLNTFNHRNYGGDVGVVDPRIPYYFYNQISEVSPDDSPENPCSYCYGYVDPGSGDFITVVPELEGTGVVSIYNFSLNIDPNEGFDQGASQTVSGLYPLGGDFDSGDGGASSFAGGNPQVPQRMLTHYALKFVEAELYLTNVVPGDHRAAFEDAMWASFDKVNEIAESVGAPVMEETDIQEYIDGVLADYDSDDNTGKLEHIMTQKWIASFGFGVDLFTDYRRTGFPVLHDGNTDNLSYTIRNREFPHSFPWPTANLQVNGNAPNQKVVTSDDAKPFWMN